MERLEVVHADTIVTIEHRHSAELERLRTPTPNVSIDYSLDGSDASNASTVYSPSKSFVRKEHIMRVLDVASATRAISPDGSFLLFFFVCLFRDEVTKGMACQNGTRQL